VNPTALPTARIVIAPERMAAWRAFLTAHARVTDVLAQELKDDEDLPLTWYDVLVQLAECPDHRARMQELAGRILLSKSGLTRLVDRMEQAGLVRRVDCPDDRRGTYAELTTAGYERLKGAAPTHLRGIKAHFADILDDDEVHVLATALHRIAARLAPP
jgi:DNA-binding MarR family transcriptional regulator